MDDDWGYPYDLGNLHIYVYIYIWFSIDFWFDSYPYWSDDDLLIMIWLIVFEFMVIDAYPLMVIMKDNHMWWWSIDCLVGLELWGSLMIHSHWLSIVFFVRGPRASRAALLLCFAFQRQECGCKAACESKYCNGVEKQKCHNASHVYPQRLQRVILFLQIIFHDKLALDGIGTLSLPLSIKSILTKQWLICGRTSRYVIEKQL